MRVAAAYRRVLSTLVASGPATNRARIGWALMLVAHACLLWDLALAMEAAAR